MMREARPAVRTAEKVASVIAVVAALVVLNGAWENQHTWQNLSWRVAFAAMLLGLAVIVQTSAVGILQARSRRTGDTPVPDFLRIATTPDDRSGDDDVSLGEPVGSGERR
jgi:ABC-type Fe3+ transport system permease subunit